MLLFSILTGAMLLGLVVVVLAYFTGANFTYQWYTEGQFHSISMLYEQYQIGLYKLPIMAENLAMTEKFRASDIQLYAWPAYSLLGMVALVICLLLALTADLSRFYFTLAMVLFVGLLLLLKLDHLMLFYTLGKWGLGLGMALYIPLAYWLHQQAYRYSLTQRFAFFLAATTVFATILYFFSGVSDPFLHLAYYGFYVPLLLTVFFIFTVGHEVVSALLKLITSTRGSSEGKNLYHFLIVSLIYLLNVALVYLRNARIVGFDFYLIDAFLLLLPAAILGIWGYRDRESTYNTIFPFYPHGALLYAALGVVATATIAFCFATSNDALLETIEDTITYTQLGFGLMFLVYALANFYTLIYRNHNVGLIMYKPPRMPYVTSRIAGTVVVAALFLQSNMIPYLQAKSGFFIGVADMYAISGDYLSSREYYNLAAVYSNTSHRMNYGLASLEMKQGNRMEALRYLRQAVAKNPTPYAYVNLAEAFFDRNQFFDGIFVLHEALEIFPDNGPLLNNLGVHYLTTNSVDSTYQYLLQAVDAPGAANAAQANIFALLLLNDLNIKSDTVQSLVQKVQYKPALANLLALANKKDINVSDMPDQPFDTLAYIQPGHLVYAHNKMLNQPAMVDSSLWLQMQHYFQEYPQPWLEEKLQFAAALAAYRNGNLSTCVQQLSTLAMSEQAQSVVYQAAMGKVALAQHAPRLATEYLGTAVGRGRNDLAPELAFAYMYMGAFDNARSLWQQVKEQPDTVNRALATDMLHLLSLNAVREALVYDDQLRYHFIYFLQSRFPADDMEALAVSIDNQNYRALAYTALGRSALQANELEKAADLVSKIQALNITSDDAYEQFVAYYIEYILATDQYELLQGVLEQLGLQSTSLQAHLTLARGVHQGFIGAYAEADSLLRHLAYENPFFETGVMAAVRHFNRNEKDTRLSYDILLNALNINPYSTELNKAYILQSLKLGLRDYAAESLEQLKALLPPHRFEIFLEEYAAALAEAEAWD